MEPESLTRCCSTQTRNFLSFIAEINEVSIRSTKEEIDYGPDVSIRDDERSQTAAVIFSFVFLSFISTTRSSVRSRHARVTATIPINRR